jgi:hypothetical protein
VPTKFTPATGCDQRAKVADANRGIRMSGFRSYMFDRALRLEGNPTARSLTQNTMQQAKARLLGMLQK